MQAEDLATTIERNRLAREIHDSLGHFLTVVHVQIEAAKSHMQSDVALTRECLNRAQTLTHEGLEEVRRSVAILRASPSEQRPLPETIKRLVEELRVSGTEATLSVLGEPRVLPPTVTFALYRATQEALTNVRRHANAARVDVAINYGGGCVTLTVKDDGRGAAATDGGFGLLGLRERVHMAGGEVDLRTAPGAGFALEVRVPS